jgi:hypothetical protein
MVEGSVMRLKTRNITRWLGGLVVVLEVSGCGAPSTEVTTVAEPYVATATTDASGHAEVTLSPGVAYDVQAATEDPSADLADMDVALSEIGSNLWIQVVDPAGGYFPATDVLQAPLAADDPIGVWLAPADDGLVARLTGPMPEAPAASLTRQMTLEAFVEDVQGQADAEGFATFVIALTAAGDLPETVDVYALPFENTYLLSAEAGMPAARHVMVTASAEALQQGGEDVVQTVQGRLVDLRAVRVPDWLLGSDPVRAGMRLHWTYVGDYELEGIACDTAGAAIDQVIAYLGLRGAPSTQSAVTDFASLAPAQIAVVSPAQGELWYDDGEGETLRLWYCESVSEAVVEEEPEEEPTEVAEEEAEETEAPEATEVAEAAAEITTTPAPAPPTPETIAASTSTGCVLPHIELWAAELAPEGADHVWQLVYRVSGASTVNIFDNVMSNPIAGTFPIYGHRDTNWVLTASSTPGCYVERNINVVVDELPPAGTYSNAVHGFPQLGTGDVQVTLHWTGEADLDLHVVDPAGEEIYSGHMFSNSGGMLDGDVNWPCGPGPAPVENVFWPRGGAPSGEYRVLVHYYRDCKDQGPVDWTVMVRVNGNVVATQSGRISEGETVLALTFYK